MFNRYVNIEFRIYCEIAFICKVFRNTFRVFVIVTLFYALRVYSRYKVIFYFREKSDSSRKIGTLKENKEQRSIRFFLEVSQIFRQVFTAHKP